MQHRYQTRSQTTINTQEANNTPLLPRVITPMKGQASSPRVPARSQNPLPPLNLSHNDLWSMETANMTNTLETHHWSQQHLTKAVVGQITYTQMEYMAMINDPDLQPL
jgi:hypothetical protein